MVLSIHEKVRQDFNKDVLVKRLNCFAADMLNTIADVAAGEIRALFEPQTHPNVAVYMSTEKDHIQPVEVVDGEEAKSSPPKEEEPGLEEDSVPSAVITPPRAPLTTSPLAPSPVTDSSMSSTSLQPSCFSPGW